MKSLSLLCAALLLSLNASAATTVAAAPVANGAELKFTAPNEDITKLIENYSTATGQRFVVDPSVRGKATILSADGVSKEEAFNLLSQALAINGFAIRTEGDTMIVQPARTIARSGVEVSTTLPAANPERMVTYVVSLKYITADEVNRNLRFLPSKDGEMNPSEKSNSLIIVDWASNIQRIDKILKSIDVPTDPKVAKMVETYHKDFLKNHPSFNHPQLIPLEEHGGGMKQGHNGPRPHDDGDAPAPSPHPATTPAS